jgi:hypothetical protein
MRRLITSKLANDFAIPLREIDLREQVTFKN